MSDNNEIILSVLNEIRQDQKQMVEKLNALTNSQTQLRTELEISRNGYTPHEVVELLHYVKDLKEKAEKQSENIRKSIITWVVPILCAAVIIGLSHMYR